MSLPSLKVCQRGSSQDFLFGVDSTAGPTVGKWYIGSDIVLPVNTIHGAFKSSPISYNSELKLYEVYLFFNEVSAVKNCSFEAVNELGKGVQDFSLNGELSYFTKYMPGSFDLMVVY